MRTGYVAKKAARRIIVPRNNRAAFMCRRLRVRWRRTGELAELRRQLDAADADIVLVNKRLDEAQGMYFPMVNRY